LVHRGVLKAIQDRNLGDQKMKAVTTVAFALATVVGVCIAGASIASYVVAEPEHVSVQKAFRPDLWTVEPKRVDPSSQHFERLPAILSSYAQQESQKTSSQALASAILPGAAKVVAPSMQDTASSLHHQWCGLRYRSYDPATDTYSAFSGARRVCMSPKAQQDASGG
jgi:hypothetical protein